MPGTRSGEANEPPSAIDWLGERHHLLSDPTRFERGIGGVRTPADLANDPAYQASVTRVVSVLTRLRALGCDVRVRRIARHGDFDVGDRLEVRVPEESSQDLSDVLRGLLDLKTEGTDRVREVERRVFEVEYSLIQRVRPGRAEWCEPG